MLRGDVRTALLSALSERPMNGYQLMQDIAARTGGRWRVSPGSIYPTLRRLRDDGLIRYAAAGRQGTLEVTEAGQQEVTARSEEIASFWSRASQPSDGRLEIHDEILYAVAAAEQVARQGTQAQLERARAVLAETAHALYGILANTEKLP
jgi:DNA-binding PadR family transcriptional regulator